MKTKFIEEKTFGYYYWFVWNCTEQEFIDWFYKKTGYKAHKTSCYGKTIFFENDKKRRVGMWINKPNNMETLSHEILHITRFWLQEFNGIDLNGETEEVYTTIHSFFMRENLKALNLKKFTATDKI